ncbi:MAG: glutamate racemase [Desulfobulbaceae bacterium]|nr:glutamate racemase [Desulfobulbaceae bacterium]
MIGIFDSGVGGMTVARAIEQLYPDLPYIYFGDLAHSPYGSKSREMLIEYSCRNTDFLLAHGAKIIVIACNSASSTASHCLTKNYPLPIVDVITPAVNKAARLSRNGRIGLIGTRATVNSGVYASRLQDIRPDCEIHSQACPLLVPLVEEGWLDRRETKMIVRKYLRPLRDKQIDTLILGCTHYPLLSKIIIPRIGKRVHIIDSSVEAALHLKSLLDADSSLYALLRAPAVENRYFVSDLSSPVQSLAASIFGRPVHLEKVDV